MSMLVKIFIEDDVAGMMMKSLSIAKFHQYLKLIKL